MILAILLSMGVMHVVYWGARTARLSRTRQSNTTEITGKKEYFRATIVLVVLYTLGYVFLVHTVFKSGYFAPFVGNQQNELRVGNGPLFMFSELFVYGLISAIPLLFAPRGERRRWEFFIFLTVYIFGISLAVFMGIAITSRRVMIIILFSIIIAWLWISPMSKSVRISLSVILIISTILGAPVLQSMRYILTPNTLTPKTDNHDGSVVNKNIPSYCKLTRGGAVPQKNITILDDNGEERLLTDFDVSVAKKLCKRSNQNFYFFLQTIASSYGLIDHITTFLQKMEPLELLFGVDYGTAWGYNIILAQVPRDIWQEKPLHYGSVAIQKWLYPGMYKEHAVTMTLPPSFIVDFLYGFGMFSLLFLSFGLGRLLAWVQAGLQGGIRSNNRITFVFSLFIMANMFNIVRGGTGFLQTLFPMMFVFILIYGFYPINNLLRKENR